MVRIVVHYRFEGWTNEDIVSFEKALKDLIGSALSATGNGYYDGFTIGDDGLAAWSLVVDYDAGLRAIMDALNGHDYLRSEEGSQVSMAVQEGNNLIFAYPPDKKGERFS
jgi:hypothetical protein